LEKGELPGCCVREKKKVKVGTRGGGGFHFGDLRNQKGDLHKGKGGEKKALKEKASRLWEPPSEGKRPEAGRSSGRGGLEGGGGMIKGS